MPLHIALIVHSWNSSYYICTAIADGLDKTNHLCAHWVLGEHPKFYEEKISEKVSGWVGDFLFFWNRFQDYINGLSRSTLDSVSQISAVNTSWQVSERITFGGPACRYAYLWRVVSNWIKGTPETPEALVRRPLFTATWALTCTSVFTSGY